LGTLAPVSVGLLYPSIVNIQNNLHSSDVETNSLESIFTIFVAIAPLFWAELMRAIQAIGASAVQSIGIRSVTDLFENEEIESTFGIFY
ncbi:11391_t:CDS:2, partial [Scutellospora calospora]